MRRFRSLARFTALWITPALVFLPEAAALRLRLEEASPRASALRSSQWERLEQRSGLEEALQSISSAAGMEEEGTAVVAQVLEEVGIHEFYAEPRVLRDPAFWRQAVREIPEILRDEPDAITAVERGKRELQVGWGLALRLGERSGRPIVELVALKSLKTPSTSLALWVNGLLRPKIPEVGHAQVKLDNKGVHYQVEGDPDWVPFIGVPLPSETLQFLRDRRLELILNVPLNDEEAWAELPWILDPRALAENIPVWGTKGSPDSPIPLNHPVGRLKHLRGYVYAAEPRNQGARTLRFEIRSSRLTRPRRHPILDRTRAEFLLEYWKQGLLRPGSFGWNRPAIEERLTGWFGQGGWKIVHRLANGSRHSVEGAIQFYEDAYLEYFRSHPEELEELLRRAKDIYDSSETNVESGTNYAIQETEAQHIHDIAIRRVVQRLGRKFEGTELLHIRGEKTADFHWSPGKVPFHKPEWIPQPALKGWWAPGSIEDFYQSSRFIVLTRSPPGFLELILHNVARFIYEDKLAMRDIAPPFWMLNPGAFPRDQHGRPRPFTPEEIRLLLQELSDVLMNSAHLFPASLRQREGIQEMQAIHVALENGQTVLPDLEFIRTHVDYLPALWGITRSSGRTPIFLARDGLTLYEFGAYVAALRDEPYKARLLYQPGAPRESASERARDEVLEHTLFETGALIAKIQDQMQAGERIFPGDRPPPALRRSVYAEFIRRFFDGVERLIRDDPRVAEQAQRIYNQFRSLDIPDGTPLVVIDTNATGRTALFVRGVLQRFSQEEGRHYPIHVFLGWARDKTWGIPELADHVRITEEPFQDLHWPFRYQETDPLTKEPIFSIKTGLSKLVLLTYQSLQIYNAAVRYVSGELRTAGLEEDKVILPTLLGYVPSGPEQLEVLSNELDASA